jgi:hypothetical protein
VVFKETIPHFMKNIAFVLSAIVLLFVACSQLENNSTKQEQTVARDTITLGTGGTSPYSYSWSHNLDPGFKYDADQSNHQGGLINGSYNIAVTDGNGSVVYQPTNSSTPVSKQQDFHGRYGESNDASFSAYREKIIKQAYMSIEVKTYNEAMASIRNIVREKGGTLSGENERHSESGIANSIIIRIPNTKFESTVEGVGGVAHKVAYKTIQATDVTEEFVDLQARIKAKKQVEKRYFEILSNAKNTNEILAVENQLRVIREEIEAKEGRLNFLKAKVGFSTINLEVYTTVKKEPILAKKEPGFSDDFQSSLTAGWNGVLSSFLGLTANWPTFIILVLGFFIARKIYQKIIVRTAKS